MLTEMLWEKWIMDSHFIGWIKTCTSKCSIHFLHVVCTAFPSHMLGSINTPSPLCPGRIEAFWLSVIKSFYSVWPTEEIAKLFHWACQPYFPYMLKYSNRAKGWLSPNKTFKLTAKYISRNQMRRMPITIIFKCYIIISFNAKWDSNHSSRQHKVPHSGQKACEERGA